MSTRTEVLSAGEREVGFRNFLKHISWNGLGVFLLNQTIISLMAIHFGATNLELGYINSAFHVAGLASLFVPRIFEGVRTNKLFGYGWMVRGFVAVFYGFVLFTGGVVSRVIILVVFTVFCLSRAVGVSVVHAVQRDFMRNRDTSGSVVRLNIRLGWSQLASQLLSVGLLSFAVLEGVFGLVLITYIGAAMNTVAAWYLLKIPARSVVEYTPDRNVLQTFLWSMRRREHAIPLLVHWLGVGLIVLFGFQVVFLRRVLDVPNNLAMLFVMFEAIAAIIANSALKPFADSIGDKPLLAFTTLGLAAVALVWVFIPGTLPLPVYFGLGFAAFFFMRTLLTLKGSVMIKSIPERNRVPYTSAANVVLGLVALAIGLIGGALGDLAEALPGVVVHEYSFTFLFTAVVAATVMVLSLRLPDERAMSLRETADIMLSMRNLRAFLDGYQLDFAADPARRETLLLSLERSATPVATFRLRQRLKGPSESDKERVLRTLYRSPRAELLADIIDEARDCGSYTRREAIFCLGAYDDPESERVLRDIVSDGQQPATGTRGCRDTGIEEVAIAMKSLARIGCTDVLPHIQRLLASDDLSARAELDLSVAEAIIHPTGPQLEELFQRAFARDSERFAVTKLSIALNQLELDPRIETYLRPEAATPGRGFEDLAEDAAEFEIVQAQKGQLVRWARVGNFEAMWTWILDAVAGEYKMDWAAALARSVVSAEPQPELKRFACLAALYVLHRCLESEQTDTPA